MQHGDVCPLSLSENRISLVKARYAPASLWTVRSSSRTLVYWWGATISCLAASSPFGKLLNPLNRSHPLGWLQEMQL